MVKGSKNKDREHTGFMSKNISLQIHFVLYRKQKNPISTKEKLNQLTPVLLGSEKNIGFQNPLLGRHNQPLLAQVFSIYIELVSQLDKKTVSQIVRNRQDKNQCNLTHVKIPCSHFPKDRQARGICSQ